MDSNKRIGMAINYNYPDYGGMLQAYATYRKIKELGYTPEAININALSGSIRNRKLIYFARNIFDLSIVKEKSRIIKKKLKIKTDKEFGNKMLKRKMAFDKFCKSHFNVSKEYSNWKELSVGCYSYDSVIVGSDQLWLPSNIAGDYYTLSFVPDDVKKIAYATSFGVSVLPIYQTEKAQVYLNRIEYLSAREKSGQKIIQKYTGRKVPLVCDPALLLTAEEWDKDIVQEKIIKDRYIFCYFMGDNPWQRDFVMDLKKRTDCKIVALLHLDQYIVSDEEYVDEAPYDISPADFINLVKNAEYICTDSFHGTVFSIIYGKKFFTFKRFSQKETLSTNTRIDTLMQCLKVENQVVSRNDKLEDVLERNIDYKMINLYLDEFRKKSIHYLNSSLKA